MPIAARQMVSMLTGKMRFQPREGDHHWYELRDSQYTIRTKVSHGANEVHDDNVRNMAEQLRLSVPQLHAAVRCTLSRDEYLGILDRSVILPPQIDETPQHAEALQLLRDSIIEMSHAPEGPQARAYQEREQHIRDIGVSQETINRLWAECNGAG